MTFLAKRNCQVRCDRQRMILIFMIIFPATCCCCCWWCVLGPNFAQGHKKILVVDDRWMKVSFFFATNLFFLTVRLLIDSVINGSLLRFQNNGDFWQFFDGTNGPKNRLQSISWVVFPIIDYIWILKINHQNVELEKTSF